MKNKSIFLTIISLLVTLCFVYEKKPDLTIVGSVCMADGIGRQSVELMMALKDKFSINFFPTTKTNWKDVPKEAKTILKKKSRKLGKFILFEDCVWVPGKDHYKILRTKKRKDQIRFAYSMFESTKIPSKWVEIFNDYFDAVIVPDSFHVQVYEDCGVTIPIFVLPLGLDLTDFLETPLREKQHFPFVFGTFGAGVSRKNLLKAIQGFDQAFGNREDVEFRVHCRFALPEVESEIRAYISEKGLKNVIYSHKRLGQTEYLKLFQQIDCYVNLSKGEGYSIQPREAMALGIPVIVTDNTAQHTICLSELVIPVPSTLNVPAKRKWGGLISEPEIYGEEFDCEIADITEAFKKAYYDYDELIHMSDNRKKWAMQSDYSFLRQFYLNLFKSGKIVLGKDNEIHKDFIVTSSPELYQKLLNQ